VSEHDVKGTKRDPHAAQSKEASEAPQRPIAMNAQRTAAARQMAVPWGRGPARKADEDGAAKDNADEKVFRAGKAPLRGDKRNQMGTGPETGSMHVGNAAQAGMARPPQHHVLPQEQRAWFAARGVNVDEYCVNLDQAHHEAIHKMDWNGQLMKAMKVREDGKGKKLVAGEIVDVARIVMGQFNIGGLPFVKFGSERPSS